MIRGGFNMKKIVFLLIALMILTSSISFVAAESYDSNRVIQHYTNTIDLHDYSDIEKKVFEYELTHPRYMATKDNSNFLTYDIDNDGNANFLIDQNENFLVCDFDNDGDVDLFVSDYDNDGDLDIVKFP